ATTFLDRAKAALSAGEPVPSLAGARVLVLGAGNTAMDVARSAVRLGASPIAIDWMDRRFARARADELAEAEAEGVDIRFLTTLERIEGHSGQVTAAMLRKTSQRSAADRPKVLPEEPERVEVDMVIGAMGYRVDTSAVKARVPSLPHRPAKVPEVTDRRWQASGMLSPLAHDGADPARGVLGVGYQALSREMMLAWATAEQAERTWAVGDAFSGPSTVVGSMAQGRDAARAVLAAKPRRPVASGAGANC
ncbi:MAG: FAD-dependent oxidoreductase, partial [Acidimicrobiales bacterium]